MSAPYLLGIDAGNTVVKAVLFDRDGNICGQAAKDAHEPQATPGHVERDIGVLWRNAATVIKAALAEAQVAAKDVAAIGTAGHGNGLYLLDKAQCPLLGIQSLDTRAMGLATELRDKIGAAVYPLCLQKPWPSQTATLLAWIKRHRPDLYREIGTACLSKDTLTLMMTGERVTDYSDMSGCGLMRLPQRDYDPALLAAYGLEDAAHLLPPAVASDAVAGRITADAAAATGLAAGTPVAAGFFDIIASMIGSGVSTPGEAAIVAGTWGINQVVLDRPLVDERIFHASCWRPDRYVACESSATSAVNLEWFLRDILGTEGPVAFAEVTRLLQGVTPGPDLPLFHPFLFGSATRPDARGAFLGLCGWHGKAELLYALFEGVVFEHRRHIDRLRAAGATFDAAALSGGGSRNPVWCQMFSDILGVPMRVAACRETGALGAAIAAGVAAGIHPDLETGIARMVRVDRTHQPDNSRRALIDARYRLYGELAETLPKSWQAYRKETADL